MNTAIMGQTYATRGKVLVVDDDPELRNLVALNLTEELACATVQAGSAKEAIALLSKHRFWCVVSDLSMEDCGLDILHFATKSRIDVPIFFFTGSDVDLVPPSSAPFHAFIKKPKIDELLDRVRAQMKMAI